MAQSTSYKDFHKNPHLILSQKPPRGQQAITFKTVEGDKDKGGAPEQVCTVHVGYAHPVGDSPDEDGNWKTKKGMARFKLPESEKARGIGFKRGMMTAFVSFITSENYSDGTPNPYYKEALDVAETLEHSRTLCYVKDSEVKTKGNTMKVLTKTRLYARPDETSEKLFKVKEGEKLTVPNAGNIPKDMIPGEDSDWSICYYGGKVGFLDSLLDAAAKLVYDNRSKIKIGTIPTKTQSQIREMFSPLSYWKKEDDGTYTEGREPSTFFNVKYFKQYDSYAKFKVPVVGEDGKEREEEIDLDVLRVNGFRSVDIIKVSNIFVGSAKCKLRVQIDQGVITNLFDRKEIDEQEEDIKEMKVDRSAMAMKMAKAKENAKNNPVEDDDDKYGKKSAGDESATTEKDMEPKADIDMLMDGGKVTTVADADEDSDDEDIET